MLGCKPSGRLTEQHDIFFGVGTSLKSLIPQFHEFWPEAKGDIHIDAWREVTCVENYAISIVPRSQEVNGDLNLYFINLGGYKKGEFDEYHYKVLAIADSVAQAGKQSKSTAFYKHYNFKGATSHIDDKYGIDVDDTFKVEDVLPSKFKSSYQIDIVENSRSEDDELHIGYLKLSKI